MTLTIPLNRLWLALAAAAWLVGLLLALVLYSARPTLAKAADTCQTFQETGFTVCGRFLEYWKANGGLAQQGFPSSKVFEEKNANPPAGDGKIHRVQYFQRARFEEHTENAAPYDVLLGLLGTEQFTAKYKSVPVSNITSVQPCQTFQETGFTLCGRFLEYWKANGGLAQQGFPISNLFEEQNASPPAGDGKIHLVQYFQRARFEAHNENQPPYDVLLGLLGAEQLKAKYPNGAPASSIPPTVSTTNRVIFASVQGAAPGQVASVIVQTGSNVLCSIVYTAPPGSVSEATGLGNKNTNEYGIVYWSWLISANTKPGTGIVTVVCNGVSATSPITIG